MKRLGARLGACVLAIGLAGCAANSPENAALGVNDPFEPVNRQVHAFNKGADSFILRPAAQAYDAVTPSFAQMMVRNAFNHLEAPRDFANHILTAEFGAAGRTLVRFTVNTLVGAGGLLDPAAELELAKEDADFGKTLAVWSVGEGPYYEIPLLGPSTVRHTSGRMVDFFLAPTTYLGDPGIGAGLAAVNAVDFRARNGAAIDSVFYDSADSYATTRAIYLQQRRSFINGGQIVLEDAPDFFDEEKPQ